MAATTHTDPASDTTRTRAPYRPPRARILRGPVTVTHTTGLTTPSWHVDPDCGGLERVETERRATREFPDVWTLAETPEGRICRMCTLESVLRTILRTTPRTTPRKPPRDAARDTVYATFSSLPPGTSGLPSTSGEARIRRLARTLRLQTVTVPGRGTVAHGRIPLRALRVLERNLVTHPLPWNRDTPADEHLQCFWVLAGDHDGTLEPRERRTLWTSARRLAD